MMMMMISTALGVMKLIFAVLVVSLCHGPGAIVEFYFRFRFCQLHVILLRPTKFHLWLSYDAISIFQDGG